MKQALYKQNETENSTVLYCIQRRKLNAVRQVRFFDIKIERLVKQALYKQNETENSTVLYCIQRRKLNAVRQVRFFDIKIERFEGSNLSHFRCLACWVVEFNNKRPFNTGWQQ